MKVDTVRAEAAGGRSSSSRRRRRRERSAAAWVEDGAGGRGGGRTRRRPAGTVDPPPAIIGGRMGEIGGECVGWFSLGRCPLGLVRSGRAGKRKNEGRFECSDPGGEMFRWVMMMGGRDILSGHAHET